MSDVTHFLAYETVDKLIKLSDESLKEDSEVVGKREQHLLMAGAVEPMLSGAWMFPDTVAACAMAAF